MVCGFPMKDRMKGKGRLLFSEVSLEGNNSITFFFIKGQYSGLYDLTSRAIFSESNLIKIYYRKQNKTGFQGPSKVRRTYLNLQP